MDKTVQLQWLLDEGYGTTVDKESWHGPNLLQSLQEIGLEEACFRTDASVRNIWEYTVHAAYWKYFAIRVILPETGEFPRSGENWYTRPNDEYQSAEHWQADIALLGEYHQQLQNAIAGLTPEDLNRSQEGAEHNTIRRLIAGISLHDAYHTGQIQILRDLFRSQKQ